jgi:hypothetical protein
MRHNDSEIFEVFLMKKMLQRDFAQEMVPQFRYPANPSDRYDIIQELPESITLQLMESGLDLPMTPKERKSVVETDYADVIDKLVVYGCDDPIQLLLSFNPLERGCEALRRATSKQTRTIIDLFAIA